MITLSVIILVFVGYAIILIGLNLGISKYKIQERENGTHPAIAVIVACKNEENNIESLLDSLMSLDYPKNKLQFVLVDDHSEDDTYQKLLGYRSDNIQVVKNTGHGKKRAIETAINLVDADWVAFTDADCKVPSQWINQMVSVITGTTHLVLGPVFIQSTNSFLSRLQAIEFLGLQGVTAGSAGMNMPLSANAANMMCRKSTFTELNPYKDNKHISTGDDLFLLMAVTARYKNAVQFSFSSEAVVRTLPASNWKSYFSQRVRWASKGSAFTDGRIQLVGMIVFMVNVIVLGAFISGGIQQSWEVAIVPFVVKLLIDLWIVLPMKKIANEHVLPLDYILSGIIYPMVVVWSVIAGWFKGNKYRKDLKQPKHSKENRKGNKE